MAIEIMVDSASGLTKEEAEAQGLLFAPLSVSIGGKEYLEGVNITPDEFYGLIGHGDFPKTSQPAPKYYLDAYLSAKAKNDDVLVLSLSSKVSGSYQAAVLARGMSKYEEHVAVVDTWTFFAGTRILLREALAKRDSLSLQDLVKDITDLSRRIRVFAGMDTLDYVYKGGRLSKLNYALGVFLHAKAIGSTDEGAVILAGKALGTKNAMKFIVDRLKAEPMDPAYPAYPIYSSDREILNRFTKDFLFPSFPDFHFENPLQINPVIGSHIGPLVYGVFYVRTPLPEKKPSLLEKAKGNLEAKLQNLKKH